MIDWKTRRQLSSAALAINISSKILLIFKMFQERQKTIDGRYLSSMVHSGWYPMGTKPIKTLEFYVFNDQFLKIRDIIDLAVKANKLGLNIAKSRFMAIQALAKGWHK